MLAELRGKISSSGSNLSDRVEDQLTGDFFGSMRYLPYDAGLKKVLVEGTQEQEEVQKLLEETNACAWSDRIKFWPNHDMGELDLLLEFENTLIGIEVKYNSGLSSDDGLDYSTGSVDDESEKSIHQLMRECEIVSKLKLPNQAGVLLYISKEQDCRKVVDDFKRRQLKQFEVILGYVSWESILSSVQNLNIENPFGQVVLRDIEHLLTRKGFNRYRNMGLTDGLDVVSVNGFSFPYHASSSFSFAGLGQYSVTEGLHYGYR